MHKRVTVIMNKQDANSFHRIMGCIERDYGYIWDYAVVGGRQTGSLIVSSNVKSVPRFNEMKDAFFENFYRETYGNIPYTKNVSVARMDQLRLDIIDRVLEAQRIFYPVHLITRIDLEEFLINGANERYFPENEDEYRCYDEDYLDSRPEVIRTLFNVPKKILKNYYIIMVDAHE